MINQTKFDYYLWLTSQIATAGSRTYHDLFERMHNIEFVWIVPHDDNRLQDGLALRGEFVNHKNIPKREATHFFHEMSGATALEVLVALSRRVAFIAGGDSSIWAWKLMQNLRLQKMSDPFDKSKEGRTRDIFDALIWRTYEKNGKGGFFPLHHPEEDQTKMEIWSQMNLYVNEMQN
jgi:hypothetical protein